MSILSTGLLLTSLLALGGEHGSSKPKGETSAQEALKLMKAGNQRFQKGQAEHPKQDPTTRQALAQGQHPHTVVISCSDSRVPPELLFDQGLGQIFVVRSAGHVIGSPEIASIEYAVEHLEANLIVVLGHASCGAVKAAINTPPEQSAGSVHLDALVASIRRNLSENDRQLASTDPTLKPAVRSNTSATAKLLLQRSAILREAFMKHGLKIVRGFYDLQSGSVEWGE